MVVPLPGPGSVVRVTGEPVELPGYAPRPRLVPLCGRVVRVEAVLADETLCVSVPNEPGHAGRIRPEWVAEILDFRDHDEPERRIMQRVAAAEPPPF